MTLAIATDNRDRAKAAYLSALDAFSYTLNTGGSSRTVTKNAVDKMRDEYLYWEIEVERLSGLHKRIKFGAATGG